MNIAFSEDQQTRAQLLPLTYTRPIADLRVGILTITEKWQAHLDVLRAGYLTESYLQAKFTRPTVDDNTIWIVNGLLPNPSLAEAILNLQPGECLKKDTLLLAARGASDPLKKAYSSMVMYYEKADLITYPWHLFQLNGSEIRADYQILTEGRMSEPITDPHTICYGDDIFLEEGAVVRAAVLNAETGPIYVGKDAEIQEGALIRGPFGMGEHSVVNMGAKIRGDSSLGPYCKVGGEVSNSILWGYSNKSHDGYLGNAVIGQWCNIGADTNNSNLKNNYDQVRFWDYSSGRYIHTDLQFCGLIMGDHSKTAINTMFNTGTSVGVAANIFGEGFPSTMIPSFAWGGAREMVTHHPRKALMTARAVLKRRDLLLTELDKAILEHIFEATAIYRTWEKQQKNEPGT